VAAKDQSKSNSERLKQSISAGVTQIMKLMEQRSDVSAKISERRAALVAEGVNRHALAAAISYARMSADVREGFDLSLATVRSAIGLPMEQGDLFGDAVSAVSGPEGAKTLVPSETASPAA